jgi:hypothetical protein
LLPPAVPKNIWLGSARLRPAFAVFRFLRSLQQAFGFDAARLWRALAGSRLGWSPTTRTVSTESGSGLPSLRSASTSCSEERLAWLGSVSAGCCLTQPLLFAGEHPASTQPDRSVRPPRRARIGSVRRPAGPGSIRLRHAFTLPRINAGDPKISDLHSALLLPVCPKTSRLRLHCFGAPLRCFVTACWPRDRRLLFRSVSVCRPEGRPASTSLHIGLCRQGIASVHRSEDRCASTVPCFGVSVTKRVPPHCSALACLLEALLLSVAPKTNRLLRCSVSACRGNRGLPPVRRQVVEHGVTPLGELAFKDLSYVRIRASSRPVLP